MVPSEMVQTFFCSVNAVTAPTLTALMYNEKKSHKCTKLFLLRCIIFIKILFDRTRVRSVTN